ncbi:hypothetical protein [Rubripirellula tenax]|nr:hypothetical protein [Rubripirellula tenax]
MKSITILVAAVTLVTCVSLENRPASAQPPRAMNADLDYEASGFVMPASGQMPPGAIAGLTSSGPVQRTGYAAQAGPGHVPQLSGVNAQAGYGQPVGYAPQTSVQQVGFLGGSDCDSSGSGGCDSGCCSGGGGYSMAPGMYGESVYGGSMYGGCDGACGGACGGTGACGMSGGVLAGGVLGKMHGGDGELSGLRHLCIFCRGDGCEACQMFSGRSLAGLLGALAPYTEAGKCAQRWYDISAEALFLDRSTSGIGTNVITQRGSGPGGTPVISAGDIVEDGIEAGARLSGALIFGVGGSIEGTYMGGQEWNGSASASSPAVLIPNTAFDPNPLVGVSPGNQPFILSSGADLYSFISEFGTNPTGGFDDTDRSISQRVTNNASFHSGEINYRRRTVGPYCRFQGSWLAGLRYLRYDNSLGLDIVGLTDDGTQGGNGAAGDSVIDPTLRFFNASDSVQNSMLGAQIGGDLWYNMTPGIQLGVELKGAWLKNEARRRYNIGSNSVALASDAFRQDEGTFAVEFSSQLAYRLSHSWTLRSAYYLIAIDEVGNPEFNREFINNAVSTQNVSRPGIEFDSLVLNGFSFGAEYLW